MNQTGTRQTEMIFVFSPHSEATTEAKSRTHTNKHLVQVGNDSWHRYDLL